MPLYEYELCEGECAVCGKGFAVNQSLNDAARTSCPTCQQAIRKIISLPNLPRITQPVSHIGAKKASFTIYKRISKESMSDNSCQRTADISFAHRTNRRRFLRSLSVAGAGLVLPARHARTKRAGEFVARTANPAGRTPHYRRRAALNLNSPRR